MIHMTHTRLMHKLIIDGNNWLKDNFGMTIQVPVKANGRLSRTLGRYIHSYDGTPVSIELSKNLLNAGYEQAFATLKHELVHYALHVSNKPYRDNDRYFIQTCNDLGVHLSGTQSVPMKRHIYNCSTCGVTTTMRRKYKSGYYAHSGCGGSFNFSKTVIK